MLKENKDLRDIQVPASPTGARSVLAWFWSCSVRVRVSGSGAGAGPGRRPGPRGVAVPVASTGLCGSPDASRRKHESRSAPDALPWRCRPRTPDVPPRRAHPCGTPPPDAGAPCRRSPPGRPLRQDGSARLFRPFRSGLVWEGTCGASRGGQPLPSSESGLGASPVEAGAGPQDSPAAAPRVAAGCPIGAGLPRTGAPRRADAGSEVAGVCAGRLLGPRSSIVGRPVMPSGPNGPPNDHRPVERPALPPQSWSLSSRLRRPLPRPRQLAPRPSM